MIIVAALVTSACEREASRQPAPATPSGLATVEAALGGGTLGNRLIAAIQVGGGPGGIAEGFGSVWVENHRASSISRIDPATNQVVAEIPAGDHTCGLAVAEDGIWVPSFDGIRRIDPQTNAVAQTIDTFSCGVGVAEARLWSVGEDSILRSFDPVTGDATEHVTVGTDGVVTAGHGAVWAMDLTPDLWRIDPATGEVTKRTRLANEPAYWTDLSFGSDSVWISIGGVIERRNPRTLRVEESADLGTQPLFLNARGDNVWVTAANRQEVLRLDPDTLEIIETLNLGDYGGALVEAFGDGWIASLNNNAVYRVRL